MATDLERLQKVRSGELTGRGVGKTYAACYDVLEWLKANPDGTVFWFLPKRDWIFHINQIFDKLFEEFGFGDVKKIAGNYRIGHARIYFQSIRTDTPWHIEDDVREATRGYRKILAIYDSIYSGDN